MSISLAEAVAVLPPSTILVPSAGGGRDVRQVGDEDGKKQGGGQTPLPAHLAEMTVTDLTHDSRQVRPGWLFCAIRGERVDGHDFAADAVAAGAVALLVERRLEVGVPQLVVPAVRPAIGPLAAAVHGRPAAQLTVVGVTGTDGKTTTCHLLEAAFGAGGLGTGVLGTVATRIHGAVQPLPHRGWTPGGMRTTPEAPDLQRLLAVMRRRGVDAVALEVSSHGLDQHRVDGTRFDVAVFTNLSRDHLDYHTDLEGYYTAKARLFHPSLTERAVICVDDDWGRRLAREATVPVVTFGTAADAAVRVLDVVSSPAGTHFRLTGRGWDADVELTTRLVGAHNALNAAAAYVAAVEAGLDGEAAAAGIAACEGVPGRLEPIEAGQPFAVLVDYAHTPVALERVVAACHALLGDGRLHVVVGCGGDRDHSKRPAMGRIAATAGRAVLTSDNPRSEDPAVILEQMMAGAARVPGAEVVVEADRRRAITAALTAANPNDVVLIAGKGHETGQERGGTSVPFDDRDVARQVLAELGWAARGEPAAFDDGRGQRSGSAGDGR